MSQMVPATRLARGFKPGLQAGQIYPDRHVIYTIIAIVVPLVELAGIIAAVHAVMTARTSQGAIAWGISLVTFPWLALPLYAVFGRSKFKGYVSLQLIQDQKLNAVLSACRKNAEARGLITDQTTSRDQALIRLAQLPETGFNSCDLLVDGEQTFDSIHAGISDAKSYILVEFYILRDDRLGREFKTRLMEKARLGVKVFVLYDEIGSYHLPGNYVRELQRSGVKTTAFHSTKGKANKFQINFRNHRKIVVIDGHTAFVGGHNVGDEYVSRQTRFGHWRDTHVRVQGPVVKAVQYCFLRDWHWATATVPNLDWRFQESHDGDQKSLIIASGPADSIETCALMFTHMINSAKERFWIASPYFVPDLRLIGALKLAALRGVDVRILLPAKPDHRTVHLASHSYYEQILPLGIGLYRYTKGFMHQKVFLVDSKCAAVGTANLDNRSLRLNFELTLLNFAPAFIENVEAMLEKDFSLSRPVELSEYTQRSFFFKLAVRFARLLSPIL
jgi:cardiolipin synthase